MLDWLNCSTQLVLDQEREASAAQLPQDISWGPLVFEARRFVELRKKTFSGMLHACCTWCTWEGGGPQLPEPWRATRRSAGDVSASRPPPPL